MGIWAGAAPPSYSSPNLEMGRIAALLEIIWWRNTLAMAMLTEDISIKIKIMITPEQRRPFFRREMEERRRAGSNAIVAVRMMMMMTISMMIMSAEMMIKMTMMILKEGVIHCLSMISMVG